MKENRTSQSLSKPSLIGLLVCLVLITITHFVFLQRQKLIDAEEANKIENAANHAKIRLQNYIFQVVSTTRTLGYLIEHDGVPDNFEKLGKELIKSNPGIHALEIVEKGTITKVYPLKGNESVLNYNIFNDKDRNKEAIKAKDRKHVFFAGPFELKQGGIGVVGRIPIFIDDRFFGFSAIVIKLDSLLHYAGIQPSFDNDVEFQISKINPNTFKEEFFIKGIEASEFIASNHVTVDVPMGEWKLYVRLKKAASPITAYPTLILGLLISVISGFFTWYIAKQPYALRRLVDEKVALLDRHDLMLSMTQETAKVGSWESNLLTGEFRWTETTKSIYETRDDFHGSIQSLLYFCSNEAGRTKLENAIERSKKTGEKFDEELKIITAKGNEKWVRITGNSKHKNGVCMNLYGATLDVDRQKKAELERNEILQSITDAFFAVDKNWHVTYWNRAAEEMFQIPEEAILGNWIWDFLTGKTESLVYKKCVEAMEKREMHQFEYYSKSLDIYLEMSVYPNPHGMSAYVKDVTVLHKHLEAIQDQNKRLRDIAWFQSHIIRAPLSRLMGATDLLSRYEEENVNIAKLVDVIDSSSKELDDIIKEISDKASELNFSDLESEENN